MYFSLGFVSAIADYRTKIPQIYFHHVSNTVGGAYSVNVTNFALMMNQL